MKVFGFWVLFMVAVGTALVLFLNISSFSVLEVFSHHGENLGMAGTSRKLKEDGYPSINDNNVNHVNLEDYRPIDPVPSSKASTIRPGPIQHGTPLMPYIPKPSPPGHPKLGVSP